MLFTEHKLTINHWDTQHSLVLFGKNGLFLAALLARNSGGRLHKDKKNKSTLFT
jgi:hypothetical protein